MKNKLLNIFAWYGVIAILTAYALISFSVIDSKSLTYLLLNLTGALGILFEAIHKKDSQPAVLNIVWALIAFMGIINSLIM